MHKKEILRSLHKIELDDPLINEISGSIGLTLDNYDASIDDFKRQLDIDTANWGLSIYEKELGITANINKPLEDRRSVIKSKLRGTGKIGATELEINVESWLNGDVEVSFDGKINIKFVSDYGIPANLDDLKQRVREIAPAHLDVIYTFKFTLYNEVKKKNVSYDYIKSQNITYFELLNGGLN
ncbi:putative phage tail protein [Cohnella sp. WQ 127256]|uniref:putative phage tail protein n=1 Tax=Cohnella sp. WQ 127256 TaxID=2938790 RepID=UPI0021194D77|nr:putative phage tail protein [Cohnella sp. WQ 127256]